MRSKSGITTSRRVYLDPSKWLHEAAMQPVAVNAAVQSPARTPLLARTVNSSGLTVECLDWEQAGTRLDAWHQLAKDSLESNVFLDPAFALSAAQHFPQAHRPMFLFVSNRIGLEQTEHIVGIFVIARASRATSLSVKLWCPAQMTLGTPLVHRDHGFDVLDSVHEWLAREFSGLHSLMLPAIDTGGKFAALVRDHARTRGLQICQFEPRSRAILRNDQDTQARLAAAIGSKRSKELRRLHRRLAEQGELTFRTARTGDEIRMATENFLALEAHGWKGNRGTALLSDASLATFSRTMTRRFAAREQCQIHGLYLNGEPVAMGVILKSNTSAYFWKTTYDEAFATYSPGVQLTLRLTESLIADPDITAIDSCAMPDHPMIDHLWPDRAQITDILVGFKTAGARSFRATASIEGTRRKMRALVKRTYFRFQRKRPS